MTSTTELLDKLTNIEKLLERLVLLLESKDEASVTGENNTSEDVDQADPYTDESFEEYFQKYGYRGDLSLREYGYSLSSQDYIRKEKIKNAILYNDRTSVYYRLLVLHKVWKQKENSANNTFVKNLETDIQFVKTNYMS